MMGIKEYETVRTALLVEWNKIADQVPTTLRNAVDAGIAAVTGAIEKAQNEVMGCQHISGHSVKRHPSQPSRCRGSTIR